MEELLAYINKEIEELEKVDHDPSISSMRWPYIAITCRLKTLKEVRDKIINRDPS